MRRTEQVQGLRLMKFEEVYGRTHRGGLSQAEAAEVLGVSDSGAGATATRRREPTVTISARRAPVDEVARVLELFDTRYWDFTAKHFHEKLVADHGFKRSYNLRLTKPMGAGARRPGVGPLPGMMLHQDGSSHEWVPGRWWDLSHHGRCDLPRNTMSRPRRSGPRACSSLRRAPATTGTRPRPAARWTRTPRPSALAQFGIELIPAYSRKGALGTHVRHLAEAPAGTQARSPTVEANRFLKEVFLPNTTPASRPRPRTGAPPSSPSPARSTTSCIHGISNDNTVRYKRFQDRRHYVKAPRPRIGRLHGPRCLARYHADGQPIDSQTREAA